MRDRGPYLGGLVDLPKLKRPDERKAVWRQAMATLARSATEEGPSPLEALNPAAIALAVKSALADGLIDDTDWLAEAAAGVALYELAAVVPPSVEQRELGRRVLGRLLQGNAETFTAIATRMALGTGKGLASVGVRARINLVIELPVSVGIVDGPLCLALLARRQLAREFIVQPSTASLPSRRTAARIFERAAREAARRAQLGDTYAVRAFSAEGVGQAFDQLLADRESLVWRHAAVARGLLLPWIEPWRKAVHDAINPKLTPTEWRRAATSIAALSAVDTGEADRLMKRLLGADGAATKDPGAASAAVWGLARAAEAEPEVAGKVLAQIAERFPAIAESTDELMSEWGAPEPFEASVAAIAKWLREHPTDPAKDEGDAVIEREMLRDLERIPKRRGSRPDDDTTVGDESLHVQVAAALLAFASEGARPAYTRARELFTSVDGLLGALEAVGEEEEGRGGALARRTALTVLRDLDMSLLERGTLIDLLRMAPSPDLVRVHEDEHGHARERIATWVLARFKDREKDDREGVVRHITLRLRRLRAMLHLVDSDVGVDEDPARANRIHARWLRIGAALLRRFEGSLPPVLRRANAATLARALDALVRAEVLDPADALLAVTRRVADIGELRILAEASMDPELRHAFARYADMSVTLGDASRSTAEQLTALEAWTREGLLDPSSRAEALRTVVVRLHQSANAIAQARSLSDLAGSNGTDPTLVAAFEDAIVALVQLTTSARTRVDPESEAAPTHTAFSLTAAVARVLSGADAALDATVVEAARRFVGELPVAVAALVTRTLVGMSQLPVRDAGGRTTPPRLNEQLPGWLPARRTLGGFYVMRALGSGGGGSVFVACRLEDRQEPDVERFALKVPSYDAAAARSISETEFFEMFRAEASALLAVPPHKNLARFVTFDTGSKPKPILVMELVEGPNLDMEIEARALDTERCFRIFDDVLAGLEAMHAVEVGHLDIKPPNIVLRNAREGVLVDFGLAGRRIRPGCATGPYGAPEVWGAEVPGAKPTPQKADVYAFGSVAFELLTGDVLFAADSELQQIALHLAHDGFPDKLRKMAQKPTLQPIAEVLFSTLRRDPGKRPTAQQLRAELRKLAPSAAKLRWPLLG